MLGGEIGAIGEIRGKARKKGAKGLAELVRRQGDDELSRAMRYDIGVIEMALALGGAPLADRKQARQISIGGPVGGEAEQAAAVAQVEPAARDEANADFLRRLVAAHDAGQR